MTNWETFWSWLLMSARGEPVYWDDATLAEWLEIKRREYEDLCSKQKVTKDGV